MTEPPASGEPSLYTDADIDAAGFHDVHVHGFTAKPESWEVRFDVDYIVEWLCPVPPSRSISFRVAPATLVFENAALERLQLDEGQGVWSLNELRREDPQPTPSGISTWRFVLGFGGSAALRATGFKLYLRRPAIVTGSQRLDWSQRGDASFEVPA